MLRLSPIAALLAATLAVGVPATAFVGAESAPVAAPAVDTELARYQAAADYSAEHDGYSVLVLKAGEVVFEAYANGGATDKAWELASGTKSFSGVMAIAAQQDGLLSLDEKVADTLTEWQADPLKSTITIRQLLTLTSGIEGGGLGRPPAYADAITRPAVATPGTQFSYGPVPFQIFGEVMRRKLAAADTGDATPLDYLKRRIFEPAGIAVGSWKHGDDDMPHLPSGARLTAREWAKFGQMILAGGTANGQQIVPADQLEAAVVGTATNPRYALTFWTSLDPEDSLLATTPVQGGALKNWIVKRRAASAAKASAGSTFTPPAGSFMAAGMGKQRLYILPALDMVVVRQGSLRSKGFKDGEFLALLLGS